MVRRKANWEEYIGKYDAAYFTKSRIVKNLHMSLRKSIVHNSPLSSRGISRENHHNNKTQKHV